MNKQQRKIINDVIEKLDKIAYEEREKYENAPEGLQDTDRVLKFEEDADRIQEAIDILLEILEYY
jgi:hypothetical protein